MKMAYVAIIIVIVAAVIAAIVYALMAPAGNAMQQACVSSGGTVSTQTCCKSATDYPNSCLIGACGCSPDNSKEVKACDCGEGRCWNGNACIGA